MKPTSSSCNSQSRMGNDKAVLPTSGKALCASSEGDSCLVITTAALRKASRSFLAPRLICMFDGCAAMANSAASCMPSGGAPPLAYSRSRAMHALTCTKGFFMCWRAARKMRSSPPVRAMSSALLSWRSAIRQSATQQLSCKAASSTKRSMRCCTPWTAPTLHISSVFRLLRWQQPATTPAASLATSRFAPCRLNAITMTGWSCSLSTSLWARSRSLRSHSRSLSKTSTTSHTSVSALVSTSAHAATASSEGSRRRSASAKAKPTIAAVQPEVGLRI
mmetsp:Transcript_81807/g.257992  ORF Transcript_81807/g.257992 Transcript_81807/m.257992 type:complete len:277 (+) Transcript_81807:169-999(+)